MNIETLADAAVVTGKELTQLANRGRFHVEKAFFAVVISGLFVGMAAVLLSTRVTPQEMAEFGRAAFFTVSTMACFMLSLFALVSASGILYAEKTGMRLDILRITPLSLATIVLGKGASIVAKSVLVLGLITPVLAATRFYGGVSADEMLKAVAVIFGDMMLFTGIGLAVSAGARTNIDRVVRSVAWLVLIGFLFSVMTVPLALSGLRSYGLAFSPFAIWAGLIGAQVSWGPIGVNVASMCLLGVFFAAGSVRTLRRFIRMSELTPAEPKVRDLFSGFRGARRRRKGKRQRKSQRDWAGTLVGNELVQTSLLPILIPLAVSVPPMLVFSIMFIRRGGRAFMGDEVASVASVLWFVLAAMIAIQSCSAIAREKQRRTAETLATTPAGGPGMLLWKSAAIALSQSLAAAILLLLLLKPDAFQHARFTFVLPRAAAAASVTILVWAAGISFSLTSRTPISAAGSLAVSFLLLGNAISGLGPEIWQETFGSWAGRGTDRYITLEMFALMLAATGAALVLLRHYFRGLATLPLAVGLGFLLGGISILIGGRRDPVLMAQLMMPIADMGYSTKTCIATTFSAVVVSAVLLAGALPRFQRAFLSGARARESR
ncbi:MAG: ABC transporter permease [Planctomycetota bacterium]|jgi:hypothetical protein